MWGYCNDCSHFVPMGKLLRCHSECSPSVLQALVSAAAADEPPALPDSGAPGAHSNSSSAALTALLKAVDMVFGSAAALSAAFGIQVPLRNVPHDSRCARALIPDDLQSSRTSKPLRHAMV